MRFAIFSSRTTAFLLGRLLGGLDNLIVFTDPARGIYIILSVVSYRALLCLHICLTNSLMPTYQSSNHVFV